MSEPIIRTSGLTKRFGDFVAVSSLTIAVEPGTIFAFLGANGSGKSTTIRMLIGVLEPTEGSIVVDGIDVIARPRRVRDRIGYMGQKVSLYQGLSIRENVEFYAGLYGIEGRALDTRWGELRERFALSEAENERPENLPAGIRQRAGLALATLHRPRLLFLDEPTAGVDVESRGLFWDRIQEEADRGVTVFVTTHFLEEVEYCDWVSFIEAGRLIADAEPEALRRRYSGGYGVRVLAPPASRERAARILTDAGATLAPRPDGVEATIPALDAPLLAELERLREAGATIEIAQPSMTDVFRAVLAREATQGEAA
ncbi:MAG TPA: ABC transporter ATP-binding protein [Candidatus Eisenbacteria bacterium]|nr:ABC transporter ATP-binding protein [Candidatus Eisenbacteria bacterium]